MCVCYKQDCNVSITFQGIEGCRSYQCFSAKSREELGRWGPLSTPDNPLPALGGLLSYHSTDWCLSWAALGQELPGEEFR